MTLRRKENTDLMTSDDTSPLLSSMLFDFDDESFFFFPFFFFEAFLFSVLTKHYHISVITDSTEKCKTDDISFTTRKKKHEDSFVAVVTQLTQK